MRREEAKDERESREVRWGGLGKTGGRKERQMKRRGERALSIHARSPNPQIISVHCLKFEPRRKM